MHRRVLPIPGAPTSVRRRTASRSSTSHTRAATPINQRRQGYGKPGMACAGAEHPREHAPSTDGMGRTERVRVLPVERLVVAAAGFEDAQPDAVRPAQTGVDARSRRTGSFPSCNRPAWPAQPGSSPGRADVASSNAQKRNRPFVYSLLFITPGGESPPAAGCLDEAILSRFLSR